MAWFPWGARLRKPCFRCDSVRNPRPLSIPHCCPSARLVGETQRLSRSHAGKRSSPPILRPRFTCNFSAPRLTWKALTSCLAIDQARRLQISRQPFYVFHVKRTSLSSLQSRSDHGGSVQDTRRRVCAGNVRLFHVQPAQHGTLAPAMAFPDRDGVAHDVAMEVAIRRVTSLARPYVSSERSSTSQRCTSYCSMRILSATRSGTARLFFGPM